MLAACNTTEETANLTEDTNAKQQLHLENLVHLKKSEQNYLKMMQKARARFAAIEAGTENSFKLKN